MLSETAIAVLGLFTGGLRQPPNFEEMLLVMTGKQTNGAKGRRGNHYLYSFNKVVCFQIPGTFKEEASLETRQSDVMVSF